MPGPSGRLQCGRDGVEETRGVWEAGPQRVPLWGGIRKRLFKQREELGAAGGTPRRRGGEPENTCRSAALTWSSAAP